MLYQFLYPLKDIIGIFNIFRYITFRSAMASFTAFLFSLLLGPWIIRKLDTNGIHDCPFRKECPELNDLQENKKGTPTMGGIIIIAGFLLSLLLWGNLHNAWVWLAVFSTLWMGILGFLDDYLKLRHKSSCGLGKKGKLIGQGIWGLVLGIYLYLHPLHPEVGTSLVFPFFKNLILSLGIFYVLFVILYMVGVTNAVNITDGLDGLAIGCFLIALASYGVISYVVGHAKFAHYLLIPYVAGSGELTVFCSSLVGACLGFLWFNSYPAEVFMGDTGSMALGGALASVALLTKQEILFLFVGGVFVLEILSVVIQVFSYRLLKRRVFKIAPLHHHFQFLGWPESKVTIRLWILTLIIAILSLATLKMR